MAAGEFHSVPEVDLRTATDEVFLSCIGERRSRDKAEWVGKPFVDLARSRPDELPPLFLAVGAGALSPSKGWTTEHGWWEPKAMYAIPRIGRHRPPDAPGIWARARLVFRPKDGSESDLVMILYNEISFHTGKPLLEEDMTLCRIYRVPKEKHKGVVHSEASPHSIRQPIYSFADDLLVNKFPPKLYSDFDAEDILNCDIPEFTNFEAEDNSVGGWDLPSIDSSDRPKKRSRPKPVGGSEVWRNFTKIYTKDPQVVYAACNHCGRMFKLKGGSTSSLLKHSKTCQCKPDSSVDTLID